MVGERKAFAAEDADQVRKQILEQMPLAPDQINLKIHPALSQVIIKALAKAPEGRYASGQELVNELERCKESATKTAAAKKTDTPAASPSTAAGAKIVSIKASSNAAKKAVAAAAVAESTDTP